MSKSRTPRAYRGQNLRFKDAAHSRLRPAQADGTIIGHVVTPHGIVGVFSEKDFTVLDFAYHGRLCTRSWQDGSVGHAGQMPQDNAMLVAAAKELARDAVAEIEEAESYAERGYYGHRSHSTHPSPTRNP